MTELHDIARQLPSELPLELPSQLPLQLPLGLAPRGYVGRIHRLAAGEAASALGNDELESRLIELGFVEGAGSKSCTRASSGVIPLPCASTM